MTEKPCSRCGEVKPLEAFNTDKRGRGGKTAECKACRNLYSAKWRSENRDRFKEMRASWNARNRDKRAAYCRRWRANNPEKKAQMWSDWYQKNKVRANANSRRYRVRKRSATGDFSGEEWEAMKEMHEHRCAYCHESGRELTQDHVVPLSKGGTHTWDNIAPACRFCNTSKKDRDLIEWLTWRIERQTALAAA